MKRKILLAVITASVWLSLSGCAVLLVGGAAGALGGYAVSKDAIEGNSDKFYENLWEAAAMVAKVRGTIKQEDAQRGIIQLEADSSKVDIRLIKLTRATTRVRVRARNKYHLPNLNLAEDIFVKILETAR